MRRWLHALVALVTLTALAFAGGAYRYCHMAEQAMASCCCAGPPGDSAHDEALDGPRAELVGEPCCESRAGEAAEAASSANLERATHTLHGGPAVLAVAAVAPARPHAVRDLALLSRHARSPVVARGPPPDPLDRRGKARARIGVTRC